MSNRIQNTFSRKKILSEENTKIEGCKVFSNKNEKEFCIAVESEISNNLDTYQPAMEKMLKTYFSTNSKIKSVQLEELYEFSPMVVKGFEEINEVVTKISSNCSEARGKGEKLKNKWLSKYNVYFKDSNDNYHLLNRLDTNYTAMSVLITIYYRQLIEQVREWTTIKSTPSSFFVKDWVQHFFNTNIVLIDPRKNIESDVKKTQTKLQKLPNPLTIFDSVLKPESFEIEESPDQKNFFKALEQVRSKGFQTEDLFEKKLKENDITYIRYSGDYSFVDMILGIDFLIKQNRKGRDYWVPVQVKSSFREKSSLVDTFKCTIVIKPELIKIKGEDDFKIGDIRGFEEYFCVQQEFCRASGRKSIKIPSSFDYFSHMNLN